MPADSLPRPAGPTAGSPSPLATRRALVAGGLGAGLLGALAACTSEKDPQGDPQNPWSTLGEQAESSPRANDVAVDSIRPEDPRGLECSLGRIQLTSSQHQSTLSTSLAGAVGGDREEPTQPVTAPEGEEFLMFTLDLEQFVWVTSGFPHPVELRIVVRRPDGEVASELLADRLVGDGVVRVVGDPGPGDAVLEVTEHGKKQCLSLIDGSLVHSDVEHVYGRSLVAGDTWPSAGVEIVGEQGPDAETEEARDEHDGSDVLSMQALAALTTPMALDLGWADDGEQFLRLELRAVHRYTRRGDGSSVLFPVDLSTSALVLADGKRREPLVVADSLRRVDPSMSSLDAVYLWFSVPVDLASAEARIAASPFPRRKGLAEELAASCAMTIPLTFAPAS